MTLQPLPSHLNFLIYEENSVSFFVSETIVVGGICSRLSGSVCASADEGGGRGGMLGVGA
jgi:hypothetical protein